MNKNRKTTIDEKKKFIIKYLIPFCLFFVVGVYVVQAVCGELLKEKQVEERLVYAQQEEKKIQKEITEQEENLAYIERKFVIESGLETNLIFVFNEFEDSHYKSVVSLLERYGYPGVIVFRDNNMPGMPGSITLEQYRTLLEKGWEGAIATPKKMLLYDNMADTIINKWVDYMDSAKKYFESNELPFPAVYILESGESVIDVQEYLKNYGIMAYTTLEDNSVDAGTFIENSTLQQIGMIKGKYTYRTLKEDLGVIQYYGQSMAIRFMTVGTYAPQDSADTCVQRINDYFEVIEENGNVRVTTFSGYQLYRDEFKMQNAEIIKKYKEELKVIEDEIERLKQKNKDNYAWAFSGYKK